MLRWVTAVAVLICGLSTLSLLLLDYQAANGGQPVGQCGSLLNQETGEDMGVQDRALLSTVLR
jgi:hypothetical protein